MLLRSTSAPILNSWLPQHCSRESSPEPESQLQRRNRSLSILSSKSIDRHTGELLHQTLCVHKESVHKSSNKENDGNDVISRRQRRSSLDESSHGTVYRKKIFDPSSTFLMERLFSSSGQGEKVCDDDDRLETLVSGGSDGMGSSGGKICTGGGVGGSGVDGGGSEDATDVYYREMINLNPGNSILTGNYANFLKEGAPTMETFSRCTRISFCITMVIVKEHTLISNKLPKCPPKIANLPFIVVCRANAGVRSVTEADDSG
ncbi:hypothetical protein IGI04_029192 [Brassica rapa subsp. trilocularis]|uniref:Transcription repressor n=1 Tax=Brassica rapa subsp. trilocularis TaxID=1813537 RepID=A0ABQ7L6B1_BRACM|nr:hypothetical protein IGI04_029192 [Brassica rapa subsp. trilocularis]